MEVDIYDLKQIINEKLKKRFHENFLRLETKLVQDISELEILKGDYCKISKKLN